MSVCIINKNILNFLLIFVSASLYQKPPAYLKQPNLNKKTVMTQFMDFKNKQIHQRITLKIGRCSSSRKVDTPRENNTTNTDTMAPSPKNNSSCVSMKIEVSKSCHTTVKTKRAESTHKHFKCFTDGHLKIVFQRKQDYLLWFQLYNILLIWFMFGTKFERNRNRKIPETSFMVSYGYCCILS